MNPVRKGLIYLDASFAIEVISAWPSRPAATVAFARLGSYAVSDLLAHELLVQPLQRTDLAQIEAIERFISLGVHLPIDEACWRRAAEIRAITRLKTPDALHLAVAETHGCAAVWSYDARLLGASTPVPVVGP